MGLKESIVKLNNWFDCSSGIGYNIIKELKHHNLVFFILLYYLLCYNYLVNI